MEMHFPCMKMNCYVLQSFEVVAVAAAVAVATATAAAIVAVVAVVVAVVLNNAYSLKMYVCVFICIL